MEKACSFHASAKISHHQALLDGLHGGPYGQFSGFNHDFMVAPLLRIPPLSKASRAVTARSKEMAIKLLVK